MANIQMSYYNGSSYVDLNPRTTVGNLTDLSGSTNILSSSTKSTLGLASNAVPDNAFSTLASMVNSRAKIATGSYVGTGTYGASNPCSLTFNFTPNILMIHGYTSAGRHVLMIYKDMNPPVGYYFTDNSGFLIEGMTWGENFVTWYSNQYAWGQANGVATYTYCALSFPM